MKKCLRIEVQANIPKGLLPAFIQKSALSCNIEGTVQIVNAQAIRIVACGKKEAVDRFLDTIYDGYKGWFPQQIIVEPFLQVRDYRGVFRIIES